MPARKRDILPYLERLRDEARVPMIYVSHNAAEVKRIASRVVRLDAGKVVATGGVELPRRQRGPICLPEDMFPPERIVCLTEETVETLYLLGEDRRIVGVSGYAVRPPQVRREKPRVSAFISADVPKILALKPDLVLTFSDLQADIVAELIRNNIAVHAFNQRDVAGIFDMIRTLGALVGAADKAEALASSLAAHSMRYTSAALRLPRRPRVYFEEWDEPMISGIAWVSELIEAAGGIEVSRSSPRARTPRTASCRPTRSIAAQPDIIIGSWCGKKFVPAKVDGPAGFCRIPAVATGWLREIKSTLILQPGPAALTDGLDQLAAIITDWAESRATPRANSDDSNPAVAMLRVKFDTHKDLNANAAEHKTRADLWMDLAPGGISDRLRTWPRGCCRTPRASCRSRPAGCSPRACCASRRSLSSCRSLGMVLSDLALPGEDWRIHAHRLRRDLDPGARRHR